MRPHKQLCPCNHALTTSSRVVVTAPAAHICDECSHTLDYVMLASLTHCIELWFGTLQHPSAEHDWVHFRSGVPPAPLACLHASWPQGHLSTRDQGHHPRQDQGQRRGRPVPLRSAPCAHVCPCVDERAAAVSRASPTAWVYSLLAAHTGLPALPAVAACAAVEKMAEKCHSVDISTGRAWTLTHYYYTALHATNSIHM